MGKCSFNGLMKMSLLGYVLLLTAALCCTASPINNGSCQRPDRSDEEALQDDWDKDLYAHGTTITYNCRPGYTRYGTIRKICTNGKWLDLGRKGECRKRPCGHPGDTPFGSFHLKEGDSFSFGAIVEYTCEEGYQMVSKERTRECAANGWTNYIPECEVRNCPPVEAANNVKVLSTSYDEEYSVGQVVRFECKNPNQMLFGAPEIFCTSEGDWNEAVPQCVEITCKAPTIDNGNVINLKTTEFKNNEVLQFTCNVRYHQNTNRDIKCTKDGWIPKPSCEEIVCDAYSPMERGRLVAKKNVYKFDDEIDVVCDDGYVLQLEPNKRRKCTANGWFPPVTCVSKRCERPVIKYGSIYRDYWYPKSLGHELDYKCDTNYLPLDRVYWGRTTCTTVGWRPEPKCFRQCLNRKASLDNANLNNLQDIYLEGEKVSFWCENNFQTPDGKTHGERTCLPDGEFTPAKCSRTCKAPEILNGKHTPSKKEFDLGELLIYECHPGYITESKKSISNALCGIRGWSEEPRCIPITCSYKGKTYKVGDVAKYTCDYGQRPEFEEGQCFQYGWGPPPRCIDILCKIPDTPNLVRSPHRASYKIGSGVSFSCKEGFDRVGPQKSYCTEDSWNPSLPTCEEEKPVQPEATDSPTKDNGKPEEKPVQPEATDSPTKDNGKPEEKPVQPVATDSPRDENRKQEKRRKCPVAYNPINAEIKDPKEEYYSNDTVTMECVRGYKIRGSPVVRCIEGRWEQPPECIKNIPCKNPPIIDNGDIVKSSIKQKYETDDVVTYSCKNGFHLIGPDETTCVNGQWSTLPTCTENSCDQPPEIEHATVLEEKDTFNHGERAKYECDNGFRFFGEDSASCVKGRWMSRPTCVETSCKPPPRVSNARINGQTKDSYVSGEKVTYVCNPGYSFERSMTGEAQCEDTHWTNLPVCRQIGEQCGPPPVVKFGDITSFSQPFYESGKTVEYKCPEYYNLQGSSTVRCWNGVWEKPPVCIEPCTADERNMDANNIQLKWKPNKKLYSKDGEEIEFKCKNEYEYEVPNGTKMRIVCEQGKLNYPKCYKKGFCVLDQSTMITNNIYYNVSTVVEPGKITFQCNEGMIPENDLESKCEWGNLKYPKCIAAKSCKTPVISNGFLKSKQQASYESGSRVEFECNENYVINSDNNVKCENGHWTDLPVCQSPCKISTDEFDKRNIQFFPSDDPNILDSTHRHGTQLSVTCKSGFRRPNQAALAIECNEGKFKYTRCFPGNTDTCRIHQEKLDENNLELEDVHDNEVYYGEGEKVLFKCKTGFSYRGKPTATCTNQALNYPTCTETGTCRIDQEMLEKNKLELRDVRDNDGYYFEGETVQFKCKIGFRNRSGIRLSQSCTNQKLNYPTCTA